MTKPKKDSYATIEELAWFKIENYSGVRGQKSADFADSASCVITLNQWATMIRDRVELARIFEAGETEYVATLFDKLKADPLTHLGFWQRYGGGTHVANMPTVKAITANRVRWLNEAMLSADANERAIVDVQLASHPESVFGDYAHVMVNLRATDKQIRDDFAKWLTAWRGSTPKVTQGDYQNKISHWAQSQVLPYMDLELFSKLTGKGISRATKLNMLFPSPRFDDVYRENKSRTLIEMHKRVFTEDVAKIVADLAESEAMPNSGEIAG